MNINYKFLDTNGEYFLYSKDSETIFQLQIDKKGDRIFFSPNKQKREPNRSVPKLPELPNLPNFEEHSKNKTKESPHQLPIFPSNSLGDKFSQNTIKDAVSGKKDDYDDDEDDLELTNSFSTNKNNHKIMTREVSDNPQKTIFKKETPQRNNKKRTDPVFIRIDKFEESLDIFSDAKEKISEIEKELKEIKETKQEEEKELTEWEEKITSIKDQIAKVDRDVFSEIE